MTVNGKYGGIFYIMDSNYNSEAVIPAASNNDRKHRRLAASANELVKIASKESGITLKESILLSYDKIVFHLNAGTTREDLKMILEVLNDLK